MTGARATGGNFSADFPCYFNRGRPYAPCERYSLSTTVFPNTAFSLSIKTDQAGLPHVVGNKHF
jgi:hypothetical protein